MTRLVFVFAARTIKRTPLRSTLTSLGLASSVATIVVAFGVAAWAEYLVSAPVRFLATGTDLWLMPSSTLRADPATGMFTSSTRFSAATVDSVRALLAPQSQVSILRSESDSLGGLRLNVIFDQRTPRGTVRINPLTHESIRGDVSVLRKHTRMADWVRRASDNAGVPPGVVAVGISDTASHAGADVDLLGADWILVRSSTPSADADRLARALRFRVDDAPRQHVDEIRTILLVSTTRSRFSPFDFRTRFAAVVVGTVFSTQLGWLARLVAVAGVLVAVTSGWQAAAERRSQTAVLAVQGLEVGATLLAFAEATWIAVAAAVVGLAGGTALLVLSVGWNGVAAVAPSAVSVGLIASGLLGLAWGLTSAGRSAEEAPLSFRTTQTL